MKTIGIMMTMDCEPTTATTHPAATGPRDWSHGERAARGYWDIGKAHDIPVTYFLHPEVAIAQADVFRELEAQGACLGLHMHPWKFSMWRYNGTKYLAHYGGLSADDQRALLTEASELWEKAIGHRPLYFRPGTFSANDAMFGVLADLGFKGGSCSAPGRMLPEMRAIWTGAEPDPHRANAEFRQARGDLDFVNVPQSMDFSALLSGRIGRRMYADLRPDTDWPTQYGVSWQTIATNIVAQIRERSPAVPTMGVLTHNHYDYVDPQEPAAQRLRALLAETFKACDAAGISLVGTTLATIVDAVMALPRVAEPFVCEGGIFETSGEVPVLDTAST